MNGIHDMGGMHGMGPIRHEANEPVFQEVWEGRIYAIQRALSTWGRWSLDTVRHSAELIPPADYLRLSYYERWLAECISLLVQHGLVTEEEIETGKPAPGSRKETPPLTAAVVPTIAFHRPSYRRESKAVARFQIGDHVRARNTNPVGHTRLPRYARGRAGIIARQRGVFVFPDTNAHFLGEQPQHLYSVCFSARELWGDSASSKDSVYLDLWESYLEHL